MIRSKACTCSAGTVTKYQKRISGPLLDRIDIHIEVPRVEYDKLSDRRLGEPSSAIQERVERAREVQRRRFAERVLQNPEKTGQVRGAAIALYLSPATRTWAPQKCACSAVWMTLAGL